MKNTFLIALVILPFISWAQKAEFVVKLKDESAPVSSKVLLLYDVDGRSMVDSAHMVNGVFTFRGTIPPYPVRARLWGHNEAAGYQNGHLPDELNFYLEKGFINIHTKDSLKYATVTGTSTNLDNDKFRAFMTKQTNAIMELNKEGIMATMAKNNTPEFQAEYSKRYAQGVDAYKAALIQYVKHNPASYASIGALSAWAGSKIDFAVVEPIYQKLSATVRNTIAGKELAKRIAQAHFTVVGAMAPNFTQNDPDGKPVSLTDFRGKYVLLDFGASWCAPCRAENPNYVKAYQQYKDKGFTLLGVSLDRPDARAAWVAAIKTDGLEWPQVSDLKYWRNDVARLYDIRSVPSNFLIDPTGKVIAIDLRGEALQLKLKEILNP